MNIKKTVLVLFLSLGMLTQLCSYPVYAADEAVNNLRSDITLTKEKLYQSNNSNESIAAITESAFITGWFGFPFYTDGSFTQGATKMSCVPVAAANVLAHYEHMGKVNLFSGTIMTQSEFDQLCTDTLWTNSGTNLLNGARGIVAYAKRKGYSASYTYVAPNWSTFKSYINSGYPVMISDGQHAFFAVGYKVEDGIQWVYTYQGYAHEPVTWYKWTYIVQNMAKIVIN